MAEGQLQNNHAEALLSLAWQCANSGFAVLHLETWVRSSRAIERRLTQTWPIIVIELHSLRLFRLIMIDWMIEWLIDINRVIESLSSVSRNHVFELLRTNFLQLRVLTVSPAETYNLRERNFETFKWLLSQSGVIAMTQRTWRSCARGTCSTSWRVPMWLSRKQLTVHGASHNGL